MINYNVKNTLSHKVLDTMKKVSRSYNIITFQFFESQLPYARKNKHLPNITLSQLQTAQDQRNAAKYQRKADIGKNVKNYLPQSILTRLL